VAANDEVVVQIRPTNVSWREVDGEVIALDLDSSTYFSTNRTGSLLWHAMVDGATVGSLVALLEDSFDVPQTTARADVNAFLKLLVANGLLARSV
jgi:fucose permease